MSLNFDATTTHTLCCVHPNPAAAGFRAEWVNANNHHSFM